MEIHAEDEQEAVEDGTFLLRRYLDIKPYVDDVFCVVEESHAHRP